MKLLQEAVLQGITATEKTTILNKTAITWVHLVEHEVPWLTMVESYSLRDWRKIKKELQRKSNHL